MSPLKVYVAAPIQYAERARRVQQIVRDAGGVITFDWTGPEGDIREDWMIAPDEARRAAEHDRKGVQDADVLVLCSPEPGSGLGLGCLLETGMALGSGKPIVILEPVIRESVFWYLPDVTRVFGYSNLIETLEEMCASIT